MASTGTASDRFTASEWTQRTMLSDLLQQKWLLIGAGSFIGALWLMSRRRTAPEEQAARRLVRDWRRIEEPADALGLLGENVPTLFRPVLLAALDELEQQVQRWFRQLEKEIQRL